ncbi:MAG: DNA-protecting protein DprA [Parcubacteria group bacterium]|nr:DNA-protecting protein DprA [Parcubacteria group bacterium]
MNVTPDSAYLHAFNTVDGLGTHRLKKIRTLFPSYEDAWRAPTHAYAAALRLPSLVRQSLEEHREHFDVRGAYERLIQTHIDCVMLGHASYPALLSEIPDSPPILYVRGILRSTVPLVLGVVGTRRCSPYGKEITATLVARLAASGTGIVSGLARGIDAQAHEATLDSGGYTIAVLGSGVDDESIYPSMHVRLAHRIIASSGAVVSEFPPGARARKSHFPQRNRIIAGLSHGVLVTDAPEKSGAMITAFQATEYGRDVFAVPGPIHSRTAAGPHRLIRMGAKLVVSASDIIEEYPILPLKEETRVKPSSNDEIHIVELLENGPLHIDGLAESLQTPVSTLHATLVMMELAGTITQVERGVYRKI